MTSDNNDLKNLQQLELQALTQGGIFQSLLQARAHRQMLVKAIVQVGKKANIVQQDVESIDIYQCLCVLHALGADEPEKQPFFNNNFNEEVFFIDPKGEHTEWKPSNPET